MNNITPVVSFGLIAVSRIELEMETDQRVSLKAVVLNQNSVEGELLRKVILKLDGALGFNDGSAHKAGFSKHYKYDKLPT
jgi:hypothetical protein